mgnify:CR=1 FL=1
MTALSAAIRTWLHRLNVGDGVYVAAATTITEDVPSDALCIGRVRAENKEGWVSKRKILKKDQ